MDAPPDLYRASREDLIALVLAHREQVTVLERQHARLLNDLATQQAVVVQLPERVGTLLALRDPPDGAAPAARPTTMPGLTPPPRTTSPPAPRWAPRKPRGQGSGRRRMPPTARQDQAFAHCLQCGTALGGGTVRHRREVIALIPARVEVTEHRYLERRCPRGHGRWQPGPALDEMVLGQGRLGIGRRSLIATLREALRLPLAAIPWYLDAVHERHLSVGGITASLATVAARAAAAVTDIRETIRGSPVVHVDETGWRQNGGTGSVWTFSTPTERAFVRGSRERGVLEGAIGTDSPGVLVSDFYAA